jgi:hypothetical protein
MPLEVLRAWLVGAWFVGAWFVGKRPRCGPSDRGADGRDAAYGFGLDVQFPPCVKTYCEAAGHESAITSAHSNCIAAYLLEKSCTSRDGVPLWRHRSVAGLNSPGHATIYDFKSSVPNERTREIRNQVVATGRGHQLQDRRDYRAYRVADAHGAPAKRFHVRRARARCSRRTRQGQRYACHIDSGRRAQRARTDDVFGIHAVVFGGNEFVDGSPQADFLAIGAGNDSGVGAAGADTLLGNQGNDVLLGNEDNDMVVGGRHRRGRTGRGCRVR